MSESALEIALGNAPHQGGDARSMLTNASCQHCGHHPFALPQVGTGDPTDEIGDHEAWLWQLVTDAETALFEAPSAPTPEEITAARRALAAANAAVRRVEAQVHAVRVALAQPSSWLRPRHRIALNAALRRGQAAIVATTSTRDQASAAYAEMDRRGAARRTYLARNRALIDSAEDARHELDRRVDAIIDAYAKSAEPPAWFRFGLGYPPRADTYTEWLDRARTAIAYRRRHGIDHPLEPTGRS